MGVSAASALIYKAKLRITALLTVVSVFVFSRLAFYLYTGAWLVRFLSGAAFTLPIGWKRFKRLLRRIKLLIRFFVDSVARCTNVSAWLHG
mgnify:FL=1|jgi:hypothetical protein